MTLVEVGNGVRLNTVEQGAEKPILLVQGWPTNSRAWKHELDVVPALLLYGAYSTSTTPGVASSGKRRFPRHG